MKRYGTILIILLISLFAGNAYSFQGKGCAEGKCIDCHSLGKNEAATLLGKGADQVLSVHNSEVPGLWEVKIEKNKYKYLLYMDYSKKFVLSGDVFRLKDHENITQGKLKKIRKVEGVRIPLDDALILGNKEGKKKVVVFTDPRCPYCRKLHKEMKIAIKRDPELVFYIKLFPLKIHPDSYSVSKTIVCSGSMELLEKSLNGDQIPEKKCVSDVVENNLRLGKEIGIHSTPTLIFPDGRIIPGYKKAEEILKIINGKK